MKGLSLDIINNFEAIAKDFSILIIQSEENNNSKLYDLIKLFFNNSNNIVLSNFKNSLFEKKEFDIIICDISSTDCDYFDIFNQIKSIDPEQSLIILTDLSNIKTILKLIDMGINQFIALPLNDKELKYRLQKNCENVFYKKYFERNESKNIPVNIEKFLQENMMNSDQFENYLKVNNISRQKFEVLTKELVDLNNQFSKCVEKIYIYKFNEAILESMKEILSGIVKQFNSINSLKNFSDVIKELISFLDDIKIEYLTNSQLNTLRIIEFIYDDISRYINNVFVYKDTVDVNYLEDSLKSSIIQLKQKMYNTDLVEEDLEIF